MVNSPSQKKLFLEIQSENDMRAYGRPSECSEIFSDFSDTVYAGPWARFSWSTAYNTKKKYYARSLILGSFESHWDTDNDLITIIA